jgi:hypothetical protein
MCIGLGLWLLAQSIWDKGENNLYKSEVNTLNLCEYLMTDIRLI